MQPARVSEEGGKDPSARSSSRIFPRAVLKFFLIFLALGVVVSALSMYWSSRFFYVQNVISTGSGNSFCGEPKTFKSWFMPPSKLMHNMSDEELLWRASLVPRVKKYPFKRVPKVALMFLTKGPLPLYTLWEQFLKGHEKLYSIYIHSLPSYNPKYPPTSVFYGRQIPSKVSEWGRMSMIDAERRLLANALLDISNEWFALLSESCIPLFSFNITYNYLIKSRHEFMGSFDDHGPHGRGRYNLLMAPEVNISDWRKGAQWFAVSRRLAVDIVADNKYYHKFNEFCRPPCYVDEHYLPTMLSIEVPQLLANRSVTSVDWSRGGAHPATFGRADITEAFLMRLVGGHKCSYNNQDTTVCFLFARKFAPSTLEPLLTLAPKVLGYGGKSSS